MNLGQHFYLREVLSGLGLTAAHFFRNMGKHIAHSLGKKDAHGAVTIQYPEERRPYSPRLRTLHRLVRREDGSPRCVACMMCETVCPAHCIYIVASASACSAATAWKRVPRTPSAWIRASWSSPRTTAGR